MSIKFNNTTITTSDHGDWGATTFNDGDVRMVTYHTSEGAPIGNAPTINLHGVVGVNVTTRRHNGAHKVNVTTVAFTLGDGRTGTVSFFADNQGVLAPFNQEIIETEND